MKAVKIISSGLCIAGFLMILSAAFMSDGGVAIGKAFAGGICGVFLMVASEVICALAERRI